MWQVMARFYNDATTYEPTKLLGEVVLSNCPGSPGRSPREQAEQYVKIFQEHGNYVSFEVKRTLGASRVEYIPREIVELHDD